jgi:hypothetical protein
LRKEGVRWRGIAIALLTAVAVLSTGWNLRPLYCTTIGLLLVSGWLHDHCNGRRPHGWWVPAAMCLWANLHPGVIAGQGLLLGAIVLEWLNQWLRINAPLARPACWKLTLIGLLGLAATFISPDPIERLLYPFRPEVAHSIQRIFVEMQPAYTFLTQPPYTIWLAYLLAAVVLLTVFLRFRQYRLWEIALLAGVTGLANLAVRSAQDWVLVMLALSVPHMAVLLRRLAAFARAQASRRELSHSLAIRLLRLDRTLKRLFNSEAFRFQWRWPVAAFGALCVVSLVPAISRRMPIQNSSEWPDAALDWMETQGMHGRFFSPPDYGSYVCWRLGERAQCYVDTRGFFFPAALIEDSHYLPQMLPGWEARLERVLGQGTDYFLLETWGARGALWQSLHPYVQQPIYCDDKSVLLSAEQVRQGALHFSSASARLHK